MSGFVEHISRSFLNLFKRTWRARQNWPFQKLCKIEGKGRSNQKNSKLESTLELPPGSQKIFEKVSRRNFIHAHRKKTSLREQMNVHRIKICSEFYVLNVPGSGQRHCRQRHAVLLCIVPSCRWIGARVCVATGHINVVLAPQSEDM